MVLSVEDKALIKNMHLLKGYGSRKLLAEFPEKNWTKSGLDTLLRKLWDIGSTDRRVGSGRPRTARTEDNVAQVEELVLSHEGAPHYRSTRQISREIGVHRSSVSGIIHKDLTLKCLKKRRQEVTESNRTTRLQRSKRLLKQYPAEKADFIWFTDEKIFTVARPKNTQNDRM